MNSYATSFSMDEELCGTPDEVLTQRRLIEAEDWLQTQQGLLSQGRTLLVFGAQRFSLASLEMFVKRFRRVLIHSGREKLNEITAHLRSVGAEVNEALSLHTAGKADVLARLEELKNARQLPNGWWYESIDANTPPELVRAIQNLYVSTLLTPLPGRFMRGIGSRVQTIVLYNEKDELVGSTTVQSLEGVGDSLDGFAMLLSTCLSATVRGLKLSPLLLSTTIAHGLEEFGADRICDIVETDKLPAMMLSKSCALKPHKSEGFIFAAFQ
jgi:hypothetical protein